MRWSRINSRTLGLLMLAACLSISGCASCPIPSSPHASLLERQPSSNLDNVHVIFVDSLADVGHWGRIEEVCCSMRELGLRNAVYFEPFFDGADRGLVEYIRGIRAENPNSRIMLVGWSLGSQCVKNALVTLDQCCEGIETVVYLDSLFLTLSDFTGHPDNADRVLLIYRANQSAPRCIPNSEVQCVDCWCHLPVPYHRDTIDSLVQEALALSMQGQPLRPFIGMADQSY